MSIPTCKKVDPEPECTGCGNARHQCVCHDDDFGGTCGLCGGDGWFDGHEEDPLWYHPGELVPCSQCGGRGHY